MEREVVRRRGWLTAEEFLDLLGATNLIPGPNSTEMAIHIGYRRAGVVGSLLAGLCFIVPAAAITAGIAWIYVHYGRLPRVQSFLSGVQAAVVAVVAVAVWNLGRSALKRSGLWVLGAAALVASLLEVPELAVVFGGGILWLLALKLLLRTGDRGKAPDGAAVALLGGVGSLGTLAAPAAASTVPPSLPAIALFFLKVGSVLYGSGYVLVAFLMRGLVEERAWLSHAALLDAVAAGQVTPGPVFTTATFVGYLLAGAPGAAVATAAIFAPSFALVWLLSRLLSRMQTSVWLRHFLDGVNACSLGLMASAAVSLAPRVLAAPLPLGVAVLSLLLGGRFGVNPSLLLLLGAAGGVLQLVFSSS